MTSILFALQSIWGSGEKAVIAEMPKRWIEERKNSDAAQWDEMWYGVLHMPPMPSGMNRDFADLHCHLKRTWAKPPRRIGPS